jgi:hypothetical protein
VLVGDPSVVFRKATDRKSGFPAPPRMAKSAASPPASRPGLSLFLHVLAAFLLFIVGALFFGGLLHHHGSPRVNLAQTIYSAVVIGVGWSPPVDTIARDAWRSAVVSGAAEAALALRTVATNGTNLTAAVTAAAVKAGLAAEAGFGSQNPVGTGTKAKIILIAMLLFNVVVVVLIARGLALFSASAAVKRAMLRRRASLKSIRIVPQASETFVAGVATLVVVPALWLIFAGILHAAERQGSPPGSSTWGYLDSLAFVIFTTFSVAMPDPVPRSGGGHVVVAILCVLNSALILFWLGVFASHVVSKRDAAAAVPASKEIKVVLEDLARLCMHPQDAKTHTAISLELLRILKTLHPNDQLADIFQESHGHPVEVLPPRAGAHDGGAPRDVERKAIAEELNAHRVQQEQQYSHEQHYNRPRHDEHLVPDPHYEDYVIDGHGHHWQAHDAVKARPPRFKTSTPPPIRTKFDDPDPAIDYDHHREAPVQHHVHRHVLEDDDDDYIEPPQHQQQPVDPQGYYEFERSRSQGGGLNHLADSHRQVLPDLKVHHHHHHEEHDEDYDYYEPQPSQQYHAQQQQRQQYQQPQPHLQGDLDPSLSFYSRERDRRQNLLNPNENLPSHHILPELQLQNPVNYRPNNHFSPLPPLNLQPNQRRF